MNSKKLTLFVNGCLYINVFIAGATMKDLVVSVKSQALTTLVSKLSHNPFEILANVFASKGEITKISAHFLN